MRFRWKKRWLWYEVEAGYRTVLNSSFVANRPTELTPVLVRPDFNVQSAPAVIGNATVGIDFQIGRFPALWHRLTSGLAVMATGNATLGSRQTMSVHYSVIY